MGNLIDRAFRAGDGFLGGAVVDFIDLQWWPVFNVADAAIVVGALLLFGTQWRHGDEEPALNEGRVRGSPTARGTEADGQWDDRRNRPS